MVTTVWESLQQITVVDILVAAAVLAVALGVLMKYFAPKSKWGPK